MLVGHYDHARNEKNVFDRCAINSDLTLMGFKEITHISIVR